MYLYNLLVFSGIISNATRLFCVPGLLYVTCWPELKTAQYLYERRSDIKSRNKKKKKKKIVIYQRLQIAANSLNCVDIHILLITNLKPH